ncbi:DUF1883 domain-containing protein [Rhizobium sp. KVB221]|uniref:DUF1883 domain-containing protein n=1 Tax=Rhizobium setariae TaxID=2801340 RepID=A0A937CND5_9HYPH|nr:DUF1883 domain-containing protein [Rhizobium setariae]MBL0371063.1 DUF1883 domain-containing protein [Rhizobium setariae]
MADFIHSHQNLAKGDIVVVQCSHQCNILLLDDANFALYRKRQKHTYFGGHYTHFPAKLAVPATGHWNVVIDLAGRQAAIQHAISYIRNTPAKG